MTPAPTAATPVQRNGKPALKAPPDSRRMDAHHPHHKNPEAPRAACAELCACACPGRDPLQPDRPIHGPSTPCPTRQANPEWWHPEGHDQPGALTLTTPETGLALTICNTCPLLDPCLQRAIEREPHGIWGGTTPDDRERLRTEAGTPGPLIAADNTLLSKGDGKRRRENPRRMERYWAQKAAREAAALMDTEPVSDTATPSTPDDYTQSTLWTDDPA